MVGQVQKELLDGALRWAASGVPVFPCGGNKRPLTEHGFQDAVTDPEKVRQLFEFFGDSVKMVGARMGKDAGMFAIDFDLYKELDAQKYMDDLAEKGMLPETRIHQTTNGGVHLFYTSEGEWPNVNPVDGVEVKGEGGYVIVPPSPGYTVLREGVIEAPADLLRQLVIKRRSQSEESIEALKAKIREAANFHDSLTRLAARLSAAGWKPEQITSELVEVLKGSVAASPEHPRHSRWQKLMANAENELARIVGTGHEKYNSFSSSEAYAEAVKTDKTKDTAHKAGFNDFHLRRRNYERDSDNVRSVEDWAGEWPFSGEGYFAHHNHAILEQRFIMHPLLCEDESVLIAAEPKTGKTAVALTMGLHIATGIDLGKSLRVPEPRGVLYFGLEGRRAIRLRIAAWRRHRSELGEVLPDFIPLFVVERSKNLLHEGDRQTLANAVVAAAIYLQEKHEVALGAIFIDTYTKAMPGGDQNSVEDTSAVFDVVNRIRDSGITAAVVFIHHKARAGNIRGSTNIEADPDVLTSISKENDIITLRLDRARSVEEGGAYSFAVHGFMLGNSSQGFAIKAPVLEALDEIAASGTDFAGAKEASIALAAIIKFGDGRHPIDQIYSTLVKAGLAPAMRVSRVTAKLRADNARVQAYFHQLIPDTGYAFAGKTIEKVIEGGLITAFLIR